VKIFCAILSVSFFFIASLFQWVMFQILLEIQLPIFSSVAYAFTVICKKSLPNPKSQRFPWFLLRVLSF
jgi:hypothetical protein